MTPSTVTAALEHVRSAHPGVTTVVYTAGGTWLYMDDRGEMPAFDNRVDVDLLSEALAEAEAEGLPHVYRLDLPVEW